MTTKIGSFQQAAAAAPARPARELTDEQKEICSLRMQPGQVMLIEAFAGAAKTSTLEEYAAAHADLSFLYMAFNTTAKDDAAKRFPSSVECRTQNSLAYADKGRAYANKLGEPKPKTIMGPMGFTFSSEAQSAIDTVGSFIHSADPELVFGHLPIEIRADGDIPEEMKKKLFTKAQMLWKRMCDPKDEVILMPHDGYVKLWQLEMHETGRLPSVFRKFDVILLDEAQDTNPTVEAVIRAAAKAKDHRIIIVGDARQNIYGFRGAVNLMDRLETDINKGIFVGAVKSLTASFRYTASIAKVATEILNADVENSGKYQIGKLVKVRGLRPNTDTKCDSEAIISRSNGGLIGAAITQLDRNPNAKIHFAATTLRENWNPTVKYRFDSLMGVWLHKEGKGRDGRDPYIRRFVSYAEIIAFAKGDEKGRGGDKELDGYAKLVEQYGGRLPTLLDRIVRQCGSPENALCFSTAHRAKGLEWDKVTLLDDFGKSCKMLSFDDPHGKADRPSRDELNLLYVAATRPRKVLVPNADLAEFMASRWGMENSIEPKASDKKTNDLYVTTDPSEEVEFSLYDDVPVPARKGVGF